MLNLTYQEVFSVNSELLRECGVVDLDEVRDHLGDLLLHHLDERRRLFTQEIGEGGWKMNGNKLVKDEYYKGLRV